MSTETHDVKAKKPIVRHEEVTVPRYKFVEKEKEITVLKEIQLEAVGKNEIVRLMNLISGELAQIEERIKSLVKYQVKEEVVKSQRVIVENVKVKNAVPENVKVKNAVLEDVKVKNPVFQDIAVPHIQQKDIDALNAYKKLADEVLSKLKTVRDYKIEEVKRYTDVVVPRSVEVKHEKVQMIVKDELIETLEDLVKKLRK